MRFPPLVISFILTLAASPGAAGTTRIPISLPRRLHQVSFNFVPTRRWSETRPARKAPMFISTPPTPTSGRPPYTVECSPGSGSTFRDRRHDAAVQASMRTKRKVRASSRSLSASLGHSSRRNSRLLATASRKGDLARPLVISACPTPFRASWKQILSQRYPAQTIVIANQGKSGETPQRAQSPAAVTRLGKARSAPHSGRGQCGVDTVDVQPGGKHPTHGHLGRDSGMWR